VVSLVSPGSASGGGVLPSSVRVGIVRLDMTSTDMGNTFRNVSVFVKRKTVLFP
jgi:hypothetical protein